MALNRTFRRYRGWLAVGAIVAIAAVAFALAQQAEPQTTATTYSTSAAETGTLSVTVSGTGNLEYGDQTEVWPDTAGTVASVSTSAGKRVKAGDVLFTLDATDAAATTAKALASYRQAQSQVAQTSSNVVKAQNNLADLQDRANDTTTTVTSADITAAKAELTSAKASLASAKVSQTLAKTDYNDALAAEDDLEVTAPVSGWVYSFDLAEGDSVVASSSSSSSSSSGSSASSASGSSASGASSSSGSSAPVIIVEEGPLVATLSVNEVDLPSLKLGQRADIEFDALPDLTMTGKVTEIADEGTVESGVVSFAVQITLDVDNDQLKPGMTASATIVTNVVRNALLVPNAAVKSDDDGSYVQVLDTNGQPQRAAVEAGLSGDTQTEIKAGLEEGAQVVTSTSDPSSASSSSQQSNRPGGGLLMMGGGPGR